jgi:DNA-binding XRE family transcriptional regulator
MKCAAFRFRALRDRVANTPLTLERGSHRIIPVGPKEQRGRGRPRKTQTKLSRWIDAHKLERGVVADRLGVARNYLDKLCREDARPSLQLAVAIAKLTGGAVPAAAWLRVSPRSVRLNNPAQK